MKKTIVIIGGGSAALFVAAQLDTNKYNVRLFEKQNSLGRKFLVAGYGGLNLSFDEDAPAMSAKYLPSEFMAPYINKYDTSFLRRWYKSIGISTFTGSSGRVFPDSIYKPIDVLNAIVEKLRTRGVEIYTNHKWSGFDGKKLMMTHQHKTFAVEADYYIWSLGGSSWSKTGSDGTWKELFEEKGIATIDFQPSNCAFKVDWRKPFISQYEGDFIKNISISIDDFHQSGELTISKFGLEGNAIYPLSPYLRTALNKMEQTIVYIDLKPDFSEQKLIKKINDFPTHMNISTGLVKVLRFSKSMLALLKFYTSKESFLDVVGLAKLIKALPIPISGISPIDQAISTVGGIALSELNVDLTLKSMDNHYCIGEMIDWDAPTGGYLLQACFSMASTVADSLNSK